MDFSKNTRLRTIGAARGKTSTFFHEQWFRPEREAQRQQAFYARMEWIKIPFPRNPAL
ncbi:hypothetical protein [Microvirga sp. 2TAF3]|uniref:hypothetical protein n=1 Tax=Microvirga sp. 2TAF3 TaxID=3233014 RepID=UPI003F9C4DD5